MSNLPYVSKLLEKVVDQSVCRNNYSTETVLVKVQNNIAEALDQKRVVVLVMLDLSSAFHVIDHGIMLKTHLVCLQKPWIGCDPTSVAECNVFLTAPQLRSMHIYAAACHKDPCWDRNCTAYTLNQLVI